MFFRWLPFILAIATSAAGAIDLYQKRNEYKDRRLRQTVVFLFILTGLLTIFALYHDNDEKAKTEKKSEQNVADLKSKVDAATNAENTAIQDQKNNTDVFAKQFKALSGELADLKTQVRTEALRKKIDSLQAELLNTQRAVAPGPKATLAFSFFPFENPSPPAAAHALTDVRLPIEADQTVHVEFSILNLTDVDAVNVSVTLGIPNECRFAKDPEGFKKLPGDPDAQRYIALPQVHALEFLRPVVADIAVPSSMSQFSMGIMYRCNTCVLPRQPSSGTVHVMRDFYRPLK